eukprot:3752426-Pleurochrysis_carterae.AAC.1
MMNSARTQMKTREATKNEHKAYVQRRRDNRGNMNKALFQRWRSRVRHECDEQVEEKEDWNRRLERKRTYGIKHWGKVRSIPKIYKQVKNFMQMGIGWFLCREC